MQLTQEQINQLKMKGLTDDKISVMAQQRGYTLPPKTRLTNSQINDLRANGLDDAKIVTLAEQKGYELPEEPGFIKSMALSVASPFAKLIASGRSLAETAGSLALDLVGQEEEAQKLWESSTRGVRTGYNLGAFGNVKPLGSTGTFKDVTEAMGVGAEIGSWAVQGGGVRALVGQTLKKQILKGALTEGIAGATGGVLMMGGVEAQRPGATAGSIATESLKGGAFGGAGGAILGAGAPLVAKVAQSTPAKIVMNKILPVTEKRATAIENAVLESRKVIAQEYEKSFPLTPRQKMKEQNLLNNTGDNVYTTLAKYDINATTDDALPKLQDLSNLYRDAIESARREEGVLFNISEATNNAVAKLQDRLNSEVAIESATKKITDEIGAVLKKNNSKIVVSESGDMLVPSEIMEQLRKIGNDMTPFNASDPMRIGKSAGYSLADAIRDQVEKQGTFSAYREASREWAKIIHAQEVISDLIDSGKTWKLPGIFGGLSGSVTRKILSGALGYHMGGLGGALLTELGSETVAKVLANPDLRTYFDRKLIEMLGKKTTPKALEKLKLQVKQEIIERASRLKLPPGTPRMPSPQQPKTPMAVPAQSQVIRNPQTGRFEKIYQSVPKSTETMPPTKTPSIIKPKNANISKTIPPSTGKATKPVDKPWYENTQSGKILATGGRSNSKAKAMAQELSQTLRGTKGMTADDIMATYPDIKLKKDVPATDIYGNKVKIPDGEVLTPYELKGNKILLQDGETYIVSKSQFQNIKGQSVSKEVKEFAPELKGLEESVKGSKDDIAYKEVFKKIKKAQSEDNWAEAERLQATWDNKNTTKYSQYQLPDGKNYKEILIKAPVKKGDISSSKRASIELEKQGITFEPDMDGGVYPVKNGEILEYDELSPDIKRLVNQASAGVEDSETFYNNLNAPGFKSSHWDEPNVISHLRMNERTYKGKKVAFMEELQSDWAREARKGITSPEARKAFDDFSNQLKKKYGTTDPTMKATPEERAKWMKMLDNAHGVPNNPNLKNWQELSIKRALKEAVDNDAEYFAWINGEQTSARYNLATYVDNVEWNKSSKPQFEKGISIRPNNKTSSIDIYLDKNGIIKQSDRRDWQGKKLDEVLGKGLADKIMEKESGNLSGEGLKFGGEWANNLYDKQVGNIVSDLTGAKVEKLDLGLPIEGKGKEWVIGNSRETRITVNSDMLNEKMIGQQVMPKSDAGDIYIITDILGDGKFKAVPKADTFKFSERFSLSERELNSAYKIDGDLWAKGNKETFDISQKTTTQQGIKLTPEIKAKIRGEAPKFKASGKQFENTRPQPIDKRNIIKNVGSVATSPLGIGAGATAIGAGVLKYAESKLKK